MEVMTVTLPNLDTTPRRRSLRCLLGFHSWVVRYNDAHERFDECSRCGRVDAYMPLTLPRM